MKYGSVCSGIEAATVAWHQLGWNASWFAEIEPFPSAVLAHHYPNVANLGDMTLIADKVLSGEVDAPDLLVGGTPCQAFSVAGLRAGLSDNRGQLTIKYVELINAVDTIRRRNNKPECIVVWENVPGVLSSKDNAFGCFLGALCGEEQELIPSGEKWTNAGAVSGPERQIAWRILDAQHFGVPQRRRRIYVVASARKDFDPKKVLFEQKSLSGNIETCRSKRKKTASFVETGFADYRESSVGGTLKATGGNLNGGSESLVLASGKETTGALMASSGQKCFLNNQDAFSGDFFVVSKDNKVANCLTAGSGQRYSLSAETFVVHGTQDPCVSKDKAFTLGRNNGQENAIVLDGSTIGRKPMNGGNGNGFDESGICYTLTATDRHAAAYACMHETMDPTKTGTLTRSYGAGGPDLDTKPLILENSVRRLTPVECERLQGFPDNYTQIPYRNKSPEDCPDSPRYKALGNSMATVVMKWIGIRIDNAIKALEVA